MAREANSQRLTAGKEKEMKVLHREIEHCRDCPCLTFYDEWDEWICGYNPHVLNKPFAAGIDPDGDIPELCPLPDKEAAEGGERRKR